MKSNQIFWAVVPAIFLLGGILSFADSAAAAALRIMPLGDSITAGYTDNPVWNVPFEFGYRSGLYTQLTNAGYDFVFVGGSAEPFNNIFGDPTHGGTVSPTLDLRPLGQDGHRGYGGWSVGNVNANVASFLAADDPDIILLMIGINGISASTPAQLETLVNTIVSNKPDTHLIVAQITPTSSYNQNLYNYNTYIRDTLVPNHAALGQHITTVDQYANFLTNSGDPTSINPALFSNGFNHPSNPAYDLMAETWFAGIQAVVPVPVPADADSDGDVDTADLTTMFQNWTGDVGAGGGKTMMDGDTDMDGDVDTADLTVGFQNFTGALAGLAGIPDLIYNPTNGNVQIDADGANMLVFNLQSAAQFSPPADFTDLDNNVGFASAFVDNTASAIGWTSALALANIGFVGPELANLGNIFPTGLDLAGLTALLTNNEWGGPSGTGANFDLVVQIPEPSSVVLLVLGLVGLVGFRRGRNLAPPCPRR